MFFCYYGVFAVFLQAHNQPVSDINSSVLETYIIAVHNTTYFRFEDLIPNLANNPPTCLLYKKFIRYPKYAGGTEAEGGAAGPEGAGAGGVVVVVGGGAGGGTDEGEAAGEA